MTNQEAIGIIKTAIAEVEWEYTMDYAAAFDMAVKALKAPEARALTPEEIKDGESYWLSAGKEFGTRPVICVHREDDAKKQYITFVWQYGTITLGLEDYGKTWRCWTSRPTDEQREATQWEK